MSSSAIAPLWTPPISESAELTQCSLYINQYSEDIKYMISMYTLYVQCTCTMYVHVQWKIPSNVLDDIRAHVYRVWSGEPWKRLNLPHNISSKNNLHILVQTSFFKGTASQKSQASSFYQRTAASADLFSFLEIFTLFRLLPHLCQQHRWQTE